MRKFEVIQAYEHLNPILPQRQTYGSAGYDLSSIETIIIPPHEIRLIPTGLKVAIPINEVLFIYPRSSLAIKKGLMMSNSVGVIDSDYYNNPNNEGHIMIPLYNTNLHPVTIEKEERVAQGIFQQFEKTDDDEPKNNGRMGGFGSSDLKMPKK
jgi:dUTP pyrophosphatase